MLKFIPISGRFEVCHNIYEVQENEDCEGCACCIHTSGGNSYCSDLLINNFPICSAILRKDDKSVIFKQVEETESNN